MSKETMYNIKVVNKVIKNFIKDKDSQQFREDLGWLVCDGLNCHDMSKIGCANCHLFKLVDELDDAVQAKSKTVGAIAKELRKQLHLRIKIYFGGV